VQGYFARHRVKPGITGWAQICGLRGEIDTIEKAKRRVSHDLDYIERWSLWWDIVIIARTVRMMLTRENAY
jgi:polysaccharide biosynthesis protein PslA